MSAQGIPQIAVVMGSCTAGGAYVPAMSDETDHRQEPGHDLPRRPAAGEGGDRRGRERRGAGRRRRAHAPVGRGRPPAPNDDCTRWRWRAASVANLNWRKHAPMRAARAARRRATTPTSCTASCPTDTRKPYDVREIIARIVDGSEFDEFKARYGTTLVTRLRAHRGHAGGHRRQQRHPVLRDRRMKGAHFIELCCQRKVPLRVPAEHHRLHGRAQVRERGHRQARRQDGDGGGHAPRCPSSRSSSAAASAPATTACAAAPTRRASCGCGRTRASA